jgi:hypothetical protein
MAGMTPTQLTLRELRKEWPLVAVVEFWTPFPKPHGRRVDLFGIIDVIAVGPKGTLAVQCTSASNMSSRVTKIGESEHIGAIREAGWAIEVHGWRKPKNRWIQRVVDVS